MSPPKDVTGLAPWTTNEIVYCSIAGVLLCMAFAEIVAVTGSLSYSFIKVHMKAKAAGQRGVQYLSLIIMFLFWVLRIFFLGSMLSLVPIPHWRGMSKANGEDHEFLPQIAITISQAISFSLVGMLLVVPTVISLHQIITSPRDVKERIEAIRTTSTFPRVLIVMPVYNELPEVLHVAICSAIDGDYPKEHLHIFISFDNDAISDLYRALIRNLGIPADGEYYPPVLDLYFRGVQITVSRFPHGGKRLTQKKTFGLINSIYKEYPDKTDHLFVLFIDSDIVLPASTIANFVWDMELKPNSKRLLAMTGVITVTTKDDISFINLLQDIEYVHGQFIGRAIESAVGGCVTLPGALTIFRYSAFLESYDEYFAERQVSDLWDFGRSHLGEDRYLTHLLMTKATQPKLIQFCHRATCKTEPVREWRNLMKQRRRWYLGFLTNEGAFLSDPYLWWKYPWLLGFRLIQDIVTGTSMVSYAIMIAIACGIQHWSWIWLSLLTAYFLLNWGLMFTYGFWLGRYKALFYPLMFIVGPFVSWFLLVYGVITANKRTWGGPRADAATKKEGDDGDAEKGIGNDDHNEPRGGDTEDGDYDLDEEQIELPDHLFYPNHQVPIRRKSTKKYNRNASSKVMADSDVHSLDITCEALEPVVKEHPNFAPGQQDDSLTPDPGVLQLIKDSEQADMSWDDDNDYNSDSDVSARRDSDDYFGIGPLGFIPSPDLKNDTEWWDDANHLLNLGIMPYIHQPKIPAMFASSETLILTPIISSSGSSHGSISPLLSGRDTAPGTPKTKSLLGTPKLQPSSSSGAATEPTTPTVLNRPNTPGTPKKVGSRRGSFANSLSMASRAHQDSRNSPSTIASLTLPPDFTDSPRPAFCYIPVKYLTPNHSTTTTPKMSPMILAHTFNNTPPLPSLPPSHSPTGLPVYASPKEPPAIIAAALTISSVVPKATQHWIKCKSSCNRVNPSDEEAVKAASIIDAPYLTTSPSLPASATYPSRPEIPPRSSSRLPYPSPPLGPLELGATAC